MMIAHDDEISRGYTAELDMRGNLWKKRALADWIALLLKNSSQI